MLDDVEVIVPHLKRRLSGVTATIARLVPVQSESIAIVATGPGLPAKVPTTSLLSVFLMSDRKLRIWHARRSSEMLLGLVLRHVLRKRLKLVFTSASQRTRSRFTHWLVSHMDAVVATTRETASYLQRPSQVIPHGVDTRAFCQPVDRANLRRSLGLPEHFIIGYFGRLRSSKGTDVFIDAMVNVLPHYPNASAVVMGRTTMQYRRFHQALRERVVGAGLEERILFLPEVPVDEMPCWYQILDLFVAPSHREGFGLTTFEAMACGVPVIATSVGAFDQVVMNDKTGRLIPPGNTERLCVEVAAALGSPNTVRRWSAATRRRVENGFRIEDEAGSLNALYRRMLDDGGIEF